MTFNMANDFISEESVWVQQNSSDLLKPNDMFFFVAFSWTAGTNKQLVVNK
jgi:hypothetical protein